MNEINNFWEECYKSFGLSVDSEENSIFEKEMECTDIFLSLLEKGSIILDYSCNIKENSIFLLKEGFNVTIGDISERSIETCKENLIKNGLNANLLNCVSKSEHESKFDGILCWNVLDHMPLQKSISLLEDLYKICNEDGILMCSFNEKCNFDKNSYTELEDGNILLTKENNEKIKINFFTNEEILNMFKEKWEILYFSAAIGECEKVIICRKK